MEHRLLAALVLVAALVSCAKNEEGETRVLSPKDATAILINEQAKFVIKNVEIGGQKIDTENFDKRVERIKKHGTDEALKIEREENRQKTEQAKARMYAKARGDSAPEEWVQYQSEDKIVALKDTPVPRPNRSLKECIKPNDLIDDEVIRCTRWEVEKSW